MPEDDFSVRWEGFIEVPESRMYIFYTMSDDGVRLFVNQEKLIDNWTNHGARIDKGEIALEKGICPIRLEYYDGARSGIIQLMWSSKGGRREVIEERFLKH